MEEKKKNGIVKKIGMAVVVIVLICAAVFITLFVNNCVSNRSGKATLTTSQIVEKLQVQSDLITAKLTINGIADYSDEGLPVLNKGDFAMVYKASVTAGINIADVKPVVDEENLKLYIYVPKSVIKDVKVDSNSIKYYQGNFALFNFDEKEDAVDALKMAEEDAKTEAVDTEILQLADSQSKILIKGILQDIVKDYEIVFINDPKEIQKIEKEIETEQQVKEGQKNTTVSETTAKVQ